MLGIERIHSMRETLRHPRQGLDAPWGRVERAIPTATQKYAGGGSAAATQKDAEHGRSGRRRCARPLKRGTTSGGPVRPEVVPPFFTARRDAGCLEDELQFSASFCVARFSAPANSASLLELRVVLCPVPRPTDPTSQQIPRSRFAHARDDTRGKMIVKREPTPHSLAAVRSPRMPRARSRLIARPRPVPSDRRA